MLLRWLKVVRPVGQPGPVRRPGRLASSGIRPNSPAPREGPPAGGGSPLVAHRSGRSASPRSSPPQRRAGASLFLALVLLSGCADEGLRVIKAAEKQYATLVEERRPPWDPAFDSVLAQLARVPPGSEARPRAERLRAAIEAGRRMPAKPPLARGRAALPDPTLEAQEARCAHLARALGEAAPPQKDELQRRLDECRRAASARREALHPHDPAEERDPGAHSPH